MTTYNKTIITFILIIIIQLTQIQIASAFGFDIVKTGDRNKGLLNMYAGFDFAGYYAQDLKNIDPIKSYVIGAWAGFRQFTYNITYRSDRGLNYVFGEPDIENSDFVNNKFFISIGKYTDGIFLNHILARFSRNSDKETVGKYKYDVYGIGFKATKYAMIIAAIFMKDLHKAVENLEKNFGIKGYICYRFRNLPAPPLYYTMEGEPKRAPSHFHMFGVHFITIPPPGKYYFNLELGIFLGSAFDEDPDVLGYVVDIELGLGYMGDHTGFSVNFFTSVYDFGKLQDTDYEDEQIKVGDGKADAIFYGLKANFWFNIL
ncbi:hypothetical protein ACFL20_07910 [Spirochaetota bacterium]